MKASRSAAIALCAAISGLCTGCPNGNPLGLGPTICPRGIDTDHPVNLYTDGTVHGDCYETSSWEGPFLTFRGGEHWKLEHKLGCVPLNITPYLSFGQAGPTTDVDAAGLGMGDGGDVTPLGGDSFGIVAVDDHFIIVGNDSCVDFYLRVTACGCEDAPVDAGSGAGGGN